MELKHFELNGLSFNADVIENAVVVTIHKQCTVREETVIDHTAKLLVDIIVNKADNKNVLWLLNVEEESYHKGMQTWCDSLTKYINITPFVGHCCILTNATFQHADSYENVLSIEWFISSTVSIYSRDNMANTPWESSNTKVLFLTGKPWKSYRFPALFYFLRSSIGNSLKYACMTYEQMETWHGHSVATLLDNFNRVYSKDYSLNELRTTMNLLSRDIDRPWLNINGRRDFDMLPPTLYNDVDVEIVTETSEDSLDFLTEKSFKPIVLGYPYVHIFPGHTNRLHMLGFKSYQLLNNSSDTDMLSTFETCVDNTQKVLNNIKDSDTQGRIKHNQQQAMKIHQQAINNITNIIPGFNSYADKVFCKYSTLQRETHT